MSKWNFFCALVLGGALLTATGCSLFDNSLPGEDMEAMPEAANDIAGFGEFDPNSLLANDPELAGNSWVDPTDAALDQAYPGQDDLIPVTGTGIDEQRIYFGLDMDILDPSEQGKLDAIYAYLADKPELYLVIEGHCDERGTNEYNRALGERRAISIKNYLVTIGMNPELLRTISYGEDKPEVDGSGEEAWRLNRRGVLIPCRHK